MAYNINTKWLVMKISTAIAILLFIAVASLYLFPQFLIVIPFKIFYYSDHKFFSLYILPIEREIKTMSHPDYQEFLYKEPFPNGKELTFNVPWKENPNEELIKKGIFKFSEDKRISFLPINNPNDPTLVSQIINDAGEEKEQLELKKMMGNSLSSDYDFYFETINSSPEQLSLSMTVEEAIVKQILLPMKFIIVPSLSDKKSLTIYNFKTKNLKGFQFSTNNENTRAITAFDEKDHQYDIIISATQEETDFIISSIKFK